MEYSTILRTQIGLGENTLKFEKSQEEKEENFYWFIGLSSELCWLKEEKRAHWGNPVKIFGFKLVGGLLEKFWIQFN